MAAPKGGNASKATKAPAKVESASREAAIKRYLDLKAQGKGNAEALAAAKGVCEIGHAICGLAWYADPRNTTPSATKVVPSLKGAPEDRQWEAVVALRGGAGWDGQYVGQKLSWGRACVAAGLFSPGDTKSPEGQLRTGFSKAAGVAAEGLRIGRGGRRLSNDPDLYVGNHKSIGVEDPKPRSVDRKALAEGADTYKSKVEALAVKKAAAAKRVSKATQK